MRVIKIKTIKIFIFSVVLLGSCSKYSEKVAGTYIGQISVNDSIISNNSNIIISELSNRNVSVVSDFFTLYELEIEKQRNFGSVTYFHNGGSDINLDLEIGETAYGLFLSLIYYDNFNNQYVFTGEN